MFFIRMFFKNKKQAVLSGYTGNGEYNLEVKHEIHFVYLYCFVGLCYVRYVYVYRDNIGG